MQVDSKPEAEADDASGRIRSRALPVAPLFIVLALVAAAILHFATRSELWLDEALTVNIARLPLRDIPHALRHDGAPPLYYALLHVWMLVFGEGNLAVRSLSGVIGLATLPLAYFSGVRMGATDRVRGQWIGWALVLLVATSPFSIRYSTENRMYALAILLVFLGYLAVRRALDRPTAGRLAGVTLVTAALLYSHYWSFFLLAVVFVVIAWRAVTAPAGAKGAPVRMLVALAVGGLLFVPWLPTLSYQLDHTGTPWASASISPKLIAQTLSQFAGGGAIEGRFLLLALAVLAALALFLHARPSHPADPLEGPAPSARWELLVGSATLLLGLGMSYVAGSTYQVRYAAVVFPFVMMVAAFGITAPRRVWVRYAAVAVVVALGLVGGVRGARTIRTQAGQVATQVARGAQPGDVVAYCPDQIGPATSRLLSRSAGVHQYTFPGFRSPQIVDWVDYAARNQKAAPGGFVNGLLNRAHDATIWYVWSPNYATYDLKCETILSQLQAARPHAQTLVAPDAKTFEHMGLVRFDQ
jgi:mannosyltransferase